MKLVQCIAIVGAVLALAGDATAAPTPAPAPKPVPTYADVAYGAHPHQLLDIYLPKGEGPFPVVIQYTTLWQPSKRAPGLSWYNTNHVALVVVEMRTMTDATADKVDAPISYCMLDARRALQFVRLNAAKWKLDPDRIALHGGSQGAIPALYVGCSGEKADPKSADPVERVSTKVKCVQVLGAQSSLDPKRMREWVPGVKYGSPAFGCPFDESLARREELLPKIKQWSPDWVLCKDSAPVYFQYGLGFTKPDNIEEMPYLVHHPGWGLGFQKLARELGVTCYVEYPDHPVEKYKDPWDFVLAHLTGTGK